MKSGRERCSGDFLWGKRWPIKRSPLPAATHEWFRVHCLGFCEEMQKKNFYCSCLQAINLHMLSEIKEMWWVPLVFKVKWDIHWVLYIECFGTLAYFSLLPKVWATINLPRKWKRNSKCTYQLLVQCMILSFGNTCQRRYLDKIVPFTISSKRQLFTFI